MRPGAAAFWFLALAARGFLPPPPAWRGAPGAAPAAVSPDATLAPSKPGGRVPPEPRRSRPDSFASAPSRARKPAESGFASAPGAAAAAAATVVVAARAGATRHGKGGGARSSRGGSARGGWAGGPTAGNRAAPRVRRSSGVCMKAPEFIYDLSDDRSRIRFGARQTSVTMVKPEPTGSLQAFMGSSADAIVMSSFAAGKVSRCEGTEDEYLIQVDEFDFVALRIAVELRVRCTLEVATTTAVLESLGFRLIGPGLDGIAKAIDIQVKGKLRPTPPDSRLCALSGDIEFTASGEVPAILRAAPDAALRAAARAVSESLIGAASVRFSEKVPSAYARWAAGQSV